jgi:hypothetical protein
MGQTRKRTFKKNLGRKNSHLRKTKGKKARSNRRKTRSFRKIKGGFPEGTPRAYDLLHLTEYLKNGDPTREVIDRKINEIQNANRYLGDQKAKFDENKKMDPCDNFINDKEKYKACQDLKWMIYLKETLKTNDQTYRNKFETHLTKRINCEFGNLPDDSLYTHMRDRMMFFLGDAMKRGYDEAFETPLE